MLCGSFPLIEDYPCGCSGSKRRRGFQRSNKNPYSSRGLDKFAMVSADLEARRRMIISQIGYSDISLVGFAHSSHGWIPVVVRLRDEKQGNIDLVDGKRKAISKNPTVGNSSLVVEKKTQMGEKKIQTEDLGLDGKVKKSFSWSVKKESLVLFNWKRPDSYGPLVLVFILVCLVLYRRGFAIFCTFIWWYLLPTMKGSSVNQRNSMDKDYGRKIK